MRARPGQPLAARVALLRRARANTLATWARGLCRVACRALFACGVGLLVAAPGQLSRIDFLLARQLLT